MGKLTKMSSAILLVAGSCDEAFAPVGGSRNGLRDIAFWSSLPRPLFGVGILIGDVGLGEIDRRKGLFELRLIDKSVGLRLCR